MITLSSASSAGILHLKQRGLNLALDTSAERQFALDVVWFPQEPAEGERPIVATSNSNLLVIPSRFPDPEA